MSNDSPKQDKSGNAQQKSDKPNPAPPRPKQKPVAQELRNSEAAKVKKPAPDRPKPKPLSEEYKSGKPPEKPKGSKE